LDTISKSFLLSKITNSYPPNCSRIRDLSESAMPEFCVELLTTLIVSRYWAHSIDSKTKHSSQCKLPG